jgi:transglutaminase-like putative cysteine protease
MSLWRDDLKPSQATLACLVALAVVALASMSRVIEPGYVAWALGAIVMGALFAFTFGQRSLGVGFGLLVLITGATLPALFVRQSAAGAMPTPDAFRAVRKLMAAGFAGIAKATPPVPAEAKYLILVWLSFLLLGFLGAAWIVVRRPVGAVVSALAVVTFSGSVGEGPGRNLYAIGAIAATGGYFLAEGRDRIARWGGGRITIPTWLGLPTLVAACAVAIGAPLVLGETPILRLDSPIRPRVVIIKPLSDIKRQLKVDPPLEVMRVQAARPTYWRLTSLDAYDGNEWVLEAHPRDVRDGTVPPAQPPVTGEILEQSYRLTSLLSPWLPAAYAARSVQTDKPVQVDEGSQTLLLRDKTEPGLTYNVVSRQPRVTQNLASEPKPVPDARAQLFGTIAGPLVTGARTPLDTARRLEKHFRTYRYDEDVPAGHTVARLQQFLRDKAGYCEQFAATMTLMLRGLGVDARVGVGFLPGSSVTGEYIVSTRDAHAWVEANIPGAGWTTFDPTPGRGGTSVVPPELQEQQTAPQPIPQATAVPEPTPEPQDLPTDVTEQPAASRIPMLVLYALLALAVVGAVPGAKVLRRSRRRRGAPDAAVTGAYAELIDRARDLGWRPRISETQREFVARSLHGDEHAHRLATLTARALYGPGHSDGTDASEAWASSGVAMKHLTSRSAWWRRLIAFEDPRTFLPDRPLRRVRVRVAAVLGRA